MLEIRPITLAAAKEFVKLYHRHNRPPVGHKFSLSVWEGDRLVGVATAGRPVNPKLDDGLTLEVNRTCTTGEKNANSMLYGAVWRCAKAMGYKRCITYTQLDETGVSLRAAGWINDHVTEAVNWDAPKRPRKNTVNTGPKRRWVIGSTYAKSTVE